MDKFLHNWWGIIPSLQISRIRRFVFLSLLTLSVTGVQAQTAVEFNDGVRYSQWVIESRLGDFYGNTNDFGFTTYNRNLSVKKEVKKWKKGSADPAIDYVAGLVAKATIEAADYYKAFDWAKPWFKSVEWYGNKCTVSTTPDNLDAINASKMYFGIYALANGSFSSNAESTTASKATTQLGNALTALGNYSKEYKSDGSGGYAFPANTTVKRDSKSISLDGGWFHKKDYLNEMWLDGQYMGPATLAQLKGEYSSYKDITDNDWALITKQFSIVWEMCWDETEQLLYHAFCSEARSNTWAGSAEIWTTAKTNTSSWQGMTAAGHSAAFWGRAEGWYFLALVDVLEQMQNAGLDKTTDTNNSCYTTLKGYLEKLAAGIKAKQDATSGCWYQLIGKAGNYTASYYGGSSYTETSNYLESSCTAIFAAAYLKAIRLNLLDKNTYEDTALKAYKGAVNQFMKQRADGTVDLLSCCKSAGLGTKSTFSDDKFRDGSNAYYLLGKDVTPTSTNSSDYYTEGKVMGAFILAATEYERQYQRSMLLSQDLKDSYTINAGEKISVEVLGDGSASYQWYDKDGKAVDGETDASFKPAASGSYYCIITVTPNSTSAKSVAKAASLSAAYTITTSTAEVTVNAASTGEEENTGNVENSTKTIVTEVVTFPNTTLTYTMTPVDATKIEVSATGTGNNNSYLLTDYTGYVKMDGDGSLSLSIPTNATNINVTLLSQSSVSSLKLNGDSKTSTTWSGDATNGYTYSFSINDNLAGTTYTIKKGDGTSYIHKITISYTLGSSSGTPSSDASATFTYNGSPLTFTEDAATINLASTQAGSTITVNATLATGAKITTTSENTSITDNDNVISITAPAAGTSASYTYTVKAADNTTKNYTINVIVAPVLYTVTFNAGTNGSCSTTSLTQSSQGATITLPSVTANTGYTFDGWYDTATGGNKIGDAEATYTPTGNVTLYAHYTSTGGEETGGEQPVTIDGDNETSDVVSLTGGSWSGSGASAYYGLGSAGSFTIASNNSNASISKIVLTYTENKSDRYGGTVTVTPGTYSYSSSAIQGTWTGSANSVTFTTLDKCRIKSIVVYYTTGPSLSFTTQPSNKDYAQGVSVSLVVSASVSNDTKGEYGDVTYQWYSNTTESNQNGTPLDGKNEATLKPSTAELGTTYYYCVATAAKTADASQKLTATSNVAEVTVSTPTITIITQPQGAVYTKSETVAATALSVEAKTNFNVNPSYKWYSSTTGTDESFTEITGATNANYTPSIATSGKTYYYCEASSSYTYDGTTTSYSIKSDVVCIEVVNALYKYLVTNETTKPNCNEDRYIENGSEKLVKMTFGGWKWSNNAYTKPGDDSKSITDEWSAPKPQDKVNALDGYKYAISGSNDAVQENKADAFEMYGSQRLGWFRSPERTEGGITTTSYPFTLPVRGAYMTFEPTQNGILTIYLLQNGAWNTDGNNDIIPGEFRMHAFQITNQRGLVLEEFAPKYSVTCNQKVLGGYSCTEYNTDPGSYDTSSKDISKWEEFWDLSLKERKAVYENWKNGTNGSQTIIKLDNGSFLAIQKAIVKYEFHVTGNETYYVFSNFSKLGFSGATFQPDEKQPTDITTFSGDKSLDETKKYTKITAEQQSTFLDEAKKMYEYKYTIGGEEVGKVSGVFIPQFKDITLNRTFKANQWTTLTLPFNLTQSEVADIFGEDTRIIMLDKGTNNSGAVRLSFVYHEIQNVLPGYPYLIKPTKDVTTSFTVHNKCINPHISQLEIDCGDYIFKGVTDYCTLEAKVEDYSVKFAEGDIFVSNGDGKLYISGKESYSKGYRAYIAKKSGTLAAKSISIVMNSFSDDDDTTTSIDVAEFDPTLLESLGLPVGVYNLNGQRVGNDTRNLRPGIYIVNGKKTVVK